MGPDQRFLGVLDTSPFRIAIVYSIVFAIGAAALICAVDFAVSRVVDGSTDNLIEAEVQGLREQMLVLSRSDFIELVEQRSQDQDVRGAVYLMVDPQLRPVAGNVPAWPKIDADAGKVVPVQGIGAVRRRDARARNARATLSAARRLSNAGGTRRAGAAGRQESHDARPDRRRGDDLAARPRRRLLDGTAHFGAGRRDFRGGDANHARRPVAASAGARRG